MNAKLNPDSANSVKTTNELLTTFEKLNTSNTWNNAIDANPTNTKVHKKLMKAHAKQQCLPFLALHPTGWNKKHKMIETNTIVATNDPTAKT